MSDRIVLKAGAIGLHHYIEGFEQARDRYERATSEFGLDGVDLAVQGLKAAVAQIMGAVCAIEAESDRQRSAEQDRRSTVRTSWLQLHPASNIQRWFQ